MTFIISLIVTLLILVVLLSLVAHFMLAGSDLSVYDQKLNDVADQVFGSHPDDAEHNTKIITQLAQVQSQVIKTKSIPKALNIARTFADNLSCNLITDTVFTAVIANSVECEWAVAPNADAKKRVVFFHGGAFMFGSALGHRKFSDKLSQVSGSAVLSVNYRMLPRFARMKGIDDAQKAYLWALENGPDGKYNADFITVAGDSAGGNLAHMISSWSGTNAPRQPDCVIGFCPSLDQTLSSPLIKKNQHSDPMLGQGVGFLGRLPSTLRLWFLLLSMRCNPSNPLVSPIFSDLSSLPPTLIHASSSEVLLGDSIRYTVKARTQGSSVRLQVWEDQVHDWHLFNMGFGSADVAWNEVAKFITEIQSDIQP